LERRALDRGRQKRRGAQAQELHPVVQGLGERVPPRAVPRARGLLGERRVVGGVGPGGARRVAPGVRPGGRLAPRRARRERRREP